MSHAEDEPALLTVDRDEYGAPIGISIMSAPVGGHARCDRGHRLVSTATGSESWLGLAADWIAMAAAAGEVFTAEDVRAGTGEPPRADLLGVAIKRARLAGVIAAAGVVTASRTEAHGRLLRTWRAR